MNAVPHTDVCGARSGSGTSCVLSPHEEDTLHEDPDGLRFWYTADSGMAERQRLLADAILLERAEKVLARRALQERACRGVLLREASRLRWAAENG